MMYNNRSYTVDLDNPTDCCGCWMNWSNQFGKLLFNLVLVWVFQVKFRNPRTHITGICLL